MKTDVPVQGIDSLAAAVEPFTLEHTARLADVTEAELTRLCAAVRAAECVAIETGTGVTMTADRANVTQWLAWVLMILTGAMNRPGGTWFHPGFAYQFRGFRQSAADHADRGVLRPLVRAAARRRRRSSMSGHAPDRPTKSLPATSAP